ncbi:MAG: SURF1 family protein [Ilumatobacteraceae bacterium]
MYRFLLKPKWIVFHVLCLALVVTMVNLALWQIRRLNQREDFNSTVRSHSNQTVAPIAEVLMPGVEPGSVEWRRVTVTGTYLAAKQVVVENLSQDGEAGRNVVDPLQLADGSVLIVNRGFVPGTEAVPAPPGGAVTLVGQLRRSEVRSLGQPSDAAGVALTQIRRIDIPLLSPQLGGGAPVQPMYLQLLTSTPAEGKYPANVAQPVLDNGPHLSYTIQWFVFSVCVIVGWVLAIRRSVTTRSGKQRKRRGPPPIADELAKV